MSAVSIYSNCELIVTVFLCRSLMAYTSDTDRTLKCKLHYLFHVQNIASFACATVLSTTMLMHFYDIP